MGISQAILWIGPLLLIVGVMLSVALILLRKHRHCPSCATQMQPLTPIDGLEHNLSYETLACGSCSNVATLVHGQNARFAYCTSCMNRTLRTPCHSSADGIVIVDELCELCGHSASRQFSHTPHCQPAIGTPRSNVIQFPAERAQHPSKVSKDDKLVR